MKLEILSPRKVLSKAYLRQTVVQKDIETFVTQFKRMFERLNEKESEENHKNLMSDFLKNVYYAHQYEINTKQRHDLVIHLGKSHQDAVGVIIESKKYTNKSEMISPEKPNVKALHELIRYYLIERLQDENHQVKHLIITDLYKCYIFDEVWFHQNIYENATLKKEYKDWKNSGHTTDFFYKNIAAKGIEKMEKDIPCVCVDMFALYESIKDCAEINETLPNLPQIIDVYKLFSPQHLLKLAFSNDSNSLNKAFYNEFLHIIGLTEVKDGGKKLIQRKALADRESGSLLENALNQILLQQGNYAQLNENESFSIALELCITWLNRILFLKLLEAQLIRYRNGDRKYAFMNTEYIDQFDILNELFFEVMAIPENQRRPEVVERYGHIPYLNSSLFDRSESEVRTHVSIANLKDRLEISLFGQTVLKDAQGTPLKGKKNTLRYLLEFLEAYNFGSTEEGQMQQDNKTLINAAVLGLIFEKINGYQDGSFFTPSYITMYMCRETLRRAAVQKIAEKEKSEIDNFEDLMAYCRRFYKKDDLLRLNAHINSLKICDPAVGSGHFLVSALNELICIKSDLGILIDENGLPLRYQVTIENDELFVIDAQTNDLFEYQLDKQNRLIPQLQTVQKTLFEEKRNLIESCLFGVDINPKSVMICRLRLWIELLKNAYYYAGTVVPPQPPQRGGANSQTPQKNSQTPTLPPFGGGQPSSLTPFGGGGQTLYLQTLPNIDINIKTGNSLIAKLHINDELNKFTSAQRQFVRNTLPKYKKQVELYKNAYDKATKAQIIKQIADYKLLFQKLYNPNDEDFLKLRKKEDEILALGREMFSENYAERLEQLQTEAAELEQKYNSKMAVFENAFEWRYEFPEVCDAEGKFVGFDAVIGNPPYIKEDVNRNAFNGLRKLECYQGKMDIWYLFGDLGLKLLKPNGFLNYIATNNWVTNTGASNFRNIVIKNSQLISLIDFGAYMVFDNASIQTMIMLFKKDLKVDNYSFDYRRLEGNNLMLINALNLLFVKSPENNILLEPKINREVMLNKKLTFNSDTNLVLLDKIKSKQNFLLREKADNVLKLKAEVGSGIDVLQDFVSKANVGKLNGNANVGQGVFVLSNEELKNKQFNSMEKEIIKPYYTTEQLQKYYGNPANKYWIIYTKSSIGKFDKETNKVPINDYPNIKSHLDNFKSIITSDNKPYGLHRTREQHLFEEEKIFALRKCTSEPKFTYTNFNCFVSRAFLVIQSDRINLKYLTGLLNSKLIAFWLRKKGKMQGNNYQLDKEPLLEIPIYKPDDDEDANEIIDLVDKILAKKEIGEDTLALEKEIDQLVYALYALTPEEIALVEG